MRLAGFEWRKILSGKIGWILVGFFCLNLGAYYIYMMPYIPSQEEKEIRQQWEKRLAEQDGDIEEKLAFLQTEQEECSQENLIEKTVLYNICQEYTAVTEYYAFLDGLKERADTMKTFSIFNKNGAFSQKNIQKTSEDFKRVESIEIHPMNDVGMKTLHQFYLTDVLMLLLVCLFSFQVYGRDYKSGMGNLIRVTPRGRGFLRLAQTEAVALSILMMGLLLYGSNMVMTEEILDLGNLSYNIQGMEMFRNVSFPCTTGQYLVIFMLGKLLALLFSCLVFQVFAVWFQGQNLAWICSAAVIVVSFVLWFFLPNSPQAKLFRYLNPIGLLDIGQVVGNYQNLNIFQTPVSLFTAAILFILILGLPLLGAILLLRGQGRAKLCMWKSQ